MKLSAAGRFAQRGRITLKVVTATSTWLTLLFAVAANAQLAPEPQVGPPSALQARSGEYITASIEAVVAGDFNGAYELAQQAVVSDRDGAWGYYVRAVALLALKRIDDAIGSFRDAERRFPESDPWGKSVAIWGQANAALEARPCRDATVVYERYVAFVVPFDRTAEAMGRAYSQRACRQFQPAPYAMFDPAWDDYHRGDALLAEHRFDEAVAAYRQAELRFPVAQVWGRSIAMWGQANALVEAGRCFEAAPLFQRYAQTVAQRDPQAAAMGRQYAEHRCVPIRQ